MAWPEGTELEWGPPEAFIRLNPSDPRTDVPLADYCRELPERFQMFREVFEGLEPILLEGGAGEAARQRSLSLLMAAEAARREALRSGSPAEQEAAARALLSLLRQRELLLGLGRPPESAVGS